MPQFDLSRLQPLVMDAFNKGRVQDLEVIGDVCTEIKKLREALVVAKMIPDLQREVMMAPMGDRLASANTALREAYQRLAALEPRA